MSESIHIDKQKVKDILRLLNIPNTNKTKLISNIIYNCNYFELEELYKRAPKMYHGLLSLSFLTRKEYSKFFTPNSIQSVNDIVDYIGKIAYIIKRNADNIKKFILKRIIVDNCVVKGNYPLALETINSINTEISYSYWSSTYQIKIERLLKGVQSAIYLHNQLHNKDNGAWFKIFCNAAIYTSNFDYTGELQEKLFCKESDDFSLTFNNILKTHFWGYDGIPEGEWLCFDMNSSIIDLYNNLVNILPCLSEETFSDESIRFYLKDIAESTSDPYIIKICALHSILVGNRKNANPERIHIINSYLNCDYEHVLSMVTLYLEKNPLDIEILLVYIKCLTFLNAPIPAFQKEGTIYERLCYHISELFKHENDSLFHISKLKGICRSMYHIFEFRYLDNFLCNLNKKDIQLLYYDSWKYSQYDNIGDACYFAETKYRIEYLHEIGINKLYIDNIFSSNDLFFSDDCLKISLREDTKQISVNNLVTAFENNRITPYLKDVVATFIFKTHVERGAYKDAVLFFVENKIKDGALSVEVKSTETDRILAIHNSLGNEIPLELSIFYYLSNVDVDTIYLSYKKVLRYLGVSKASEINVCGNQIQDFFLSKVVSQNVLTLHVLKFKSVEQVMDERERICNNLYNYYESKCYADEIAGILRDKRMLELNNKIDENKIYVDTQSIKDNELDEVKGLFKMYYESYHDYDVINESIKEVVSTLKSQGAGIKVLLTMYNESKDKLDYQKNVLKRMVKNVRDHFLFSPKSGLDNYLSTRIRHGTLINQLRCHFEKENLILNRKNGVYLSIDYWTKNMFYLSGIDAERCNKCFSHFSERIDGIISKIKDEYVQVSTEEIGDKQNACFRYNIDFFKDDINEIQIKRELYTYDSIIDEIFNDLWNHTDDCLENMKTMLNRAQNEMLEELHHLEKEVMKLIGHDHKVRPKFHDAVIQCTNDVQDDVRLVSKWFNRNSSVDFDFTIGQVIDTCKSFINGTGKSYFKTDIECNSVSVFKGKYFSTLYDMFHDILTNVLYYERDHDVKKTCTIKIEEKDEYLLIQVSNPIEKCEEESINDKTQKINQNLDQLLRGGKSRAEGSSGCTKIFNAVHNHLGAKNNSYINRIKDGLFIVDINLELKPLIK